MAPMQRPPRFWVLLFAVILPFIVIVCLNQAMRAAPQVDPALQLDTAMLLKSAAVNPAQLPADGWQPVRIPVRARTTGEPSSAWFRLSFTAPANPSGQWAVYLERPYANFAAYVNGAFVGDGGPMTAPIPTHRTPMLFRFPSSVLHPGTNLLEVHSVHPYALARLSDVAVGPVESIEPAYDFAHGLRVTFKHATVIVLLVLAVLIGAMSRLRRRETAYAWFACGILGWAAHIEIMLIARPPFTPEVLWLQLQGIAIGVYSIGSAMFVNHYTRLRQPRIERAMLACGLLGAAVLIIDPLWFDYRLSWFGVSVWLPFLLLVGLYVVVQLVRALRRLPTADVGVLAAASWLMLIMGLRDVLIELRVLPWAPLYLTYCVAFVLSAVGAVLLRRFALAFDAAERARDELDERVREKTAELERNLVHTKDLERERALGAERERILQDMHDGLGGHLVQALAIATSRQALQPLEEPLRTCLEELRLMVDSLEPVNGDLSSVLGSLRVRISRRLALAGVQMNWHVEDLPEVPDLGPKKVLDVARIVQEAITNALKHSRCTEIFIHAGPATDDSGLVEIRIADNGKGMGGQGKGHGLTSMRRRAAELGGTLAVESSGGGTSVILRLHISTARSRIPEVEQAPDRGLSDVAPLSHS